MLVVFSILAVAACGGSGSNAGTNPSSAGNPAIPDLNSITILYNRIDWRDDMDDTTIVHSVSELDKFYEELKAENYNDLDDDLVSRFTGGQYNDNFFNGNTLVLITFQESSGSNRHKVTSIAEDNNILKIDIDREIPDIGTADMAGWLIIIELPGNYSITRTNVSFTDITV